MSSCTCCHLRTTAAEGPIRRGMSVPGQSGLQLGFSWAALPSDKVLCLLRQVAAGVHRQQQLNEAVVHLAAVQASKAYSTARCTWVHQLHSLNRQIYPVEACNPRERVFGRLTCMHRNILTERHGQRIAVIMNEFADTTVSTMMRSFCLLIHLMSRSP